MVAALAGCGQQAAPADSPQDLLRQTTQNTAQVGSANIEMRMAAAAGSGGEVGFSLAGSFAAARKGQLPAVRTEITQFVGSQTHTTGFISTGSEAFVTDQGTAYRLASDQVAGLRQNSDGALTSQVHLDQWVESPALRTPQRADGVSADALHGTVRVAPFFNDLVRLTQGPAAGAVPQIAPGSEADLAKVVKSSTIDLTTGQQDRVLRTLHIEVVFSAVLTPSLKESLARYAGSRLIFDLRFKDVNRAVSVSAPPAPQPYSELVRQRCRQNPRQTGC